MFTIYSKTAKYAIATMVYLHNNNNNKYIKVHTIANNCDIPIQYLAKIVQKLRRSKMISSIRGPSGGIKLIEDAESISIQKIIHSLDEVQMSDNICIMGFGRCGNHPECVLHDIWHKIRTKITTDIESLTLKDIEDYKPEKLMLKG